jgi:hypothetical protein
MKEIETHTHHLHKEAFEALKEAAKAINITYGAAKQRFTIEQNLEITNLFWEKFYEKNDVDSKGIDYCRTCKKFIVYV